MWGELLVDPGTEGFFFDRGRLISLGDRSVAILTPWPRPGAWTRRSGSRRWRLYDPAFKIALPEGRSGTAGGSPARASYAEAIPSQLRRQLELYRTGQWRVLAAAAYAPRLLGVIGWSPALAFALSHAAEFCGTQSKDAPAAIERRLRRGFREALRWLGFHQSRAVARLLAKIPASHVDLAGLQYLRDLSHDDRRVRRLSHMPRLTRQMLQLQSHHAAGKLVGPGLLFELSQQEDDCSGLLSRLVTIRAVAEERPSLLRQFQSIAEIEAAFTKLDRCWRVPLLQWSAKRQIAEVALPPPPIPGTDIIRPLDTVQAMLREGETQNNCTDQHLARVLLGQCYLYAVHAPVRATVLVARDHADRWTLAEMIAADGDPVEGQALDEIRTWIMRSQGIECPLRQPADN